MASAIGQKRTLLRLFISHKRTKSNRAANLTQSGDRLEQEGLLIREPERSWLNLDFHEPMDSVSAASAEASDRRYRIAIGPHSGNCTLTLPDPSIYPNRQTRESLDCGS